MSFEEEIYGKRKLKKGIKITIILLIILCIPIGGYFAFNKIFNDPYTVYTTMINEIHDNIISFIENGRDNSLNITDSDIIKNEMNLKFQTTLDPFKDFANYKYSLDYIIDFKNEKIEEKLKISDYETESKIFDIGFYADNETYLLESNTMYNKSIELPIDGLEEFIAYLMDAANFMVQSIDYEDYEYLVTSIKDSIIKAIDKKTLKSEYTKINLDGKDQLVVKFKYDLDKKVLNEVYNNLVDDLLTNYEFIAIMSKISNLTPDEVENILNENKDSFTKADSFTINVYKKIFSNEIVKFELETADEIKIIYQSDILSMTYQKEELKLDMTGKESILTYKDADKEILEFEINKLDYNILDMKYNLNIEGYNFNGEIYISSKKKSETSSFGEFSFSLLTRIDGEDFNLRLSGDEAIYKVDKLSLINTEDTIKYDEIDESTYINIYNKGLKALEGTPFVNIYNMIFI